MSNRQTFLTIYVVGTGLTLFCGLLLIYQVSFIAPKFLLVCNCSPQQKSLIEKHYKQHQLSQQKYKPCDLA